MPPQGPPPVAGQITVNLNDPTDRIYIDPDKIIMVVKPSRLRPNSVVTIVLFGGIVLHLPIDEYERFSFSHLRQVAGLKDVSDD